MNNDLLIEIGTEELPAGFLNTFQTSKDVLSAVEKVVNGDFSLNYDSLKLMATPRRLVYHFKNLQEKQDDKLVEQKGPAKKAAYDADGNATKALLGFLRGKGATEADLETISTDKGDYLYIKKEIKGKSTEEILPDIFTSLIKAIPLPKAMRWSDFEVAFPRPIHNIICLYNDKHVAVSFGHLKSSNTTLGHRFVKGGGPKTLEINSIGEYFTKLKDANVIVDQSVRKDLIEKQINEEAKKCGGSLLPDPGLLTEVANLTEDPLAIAGSFEDSYLVMPKELIINAMREHQRYFSVMKDDENLCPNFITIANTTNGDSETIKSGNERVLRARLSDAKFYFDMDIKSSLSDLTANLKSVVFQAKLGLSYDKVKRFSELSLIIASKLNLCDDKTFNFNMEDALNNSKTKTFSDRLARAAVLSKADLMSGVVGEFPSLQGLMGMNYALKAGEDKTVATAIFEHYMPVGAGAELPTTDEGSLISISDKLDTITSCFAVGLIPTGTQDPYALRRGALGIIAITLNKSYRFNIEELIGEAFDLLRDEPASKNRGDREETIAAVLNFFKERLKQQLLRVDLTFDSIDSVLAAPNWTDITLAVEKIKAIEEFKGHPDIESLVAGFKRISNILKDFTTDNSVDEKLLSEEAELALYKKIAEIESKLTTLIKDENYKDALSTLASLKSEIDSFFDTVMVMDKDEKIKTNRLTLLYKIKAMFFNIADISKLSL